MPYTCQRCGRLLQDYFLFCDVCGLPVQRQDTRAQSAPPVNMAQSVPSPLVPGRNKLVIDRGFLIARLAGMQKAARSSSRFFTVFSIVFFANMLWGVAGFLSSPILGLGIMLFFSAFGTVFLILGQSLKNREREIEAMDPARLQIAVRIVRIDRMTPVTSTTHDDCGPDATTYSVDVRFSDGTKKSYPDERLYDLARSRAHFFIGQECYLITVNGMMIDDDLYLCSAYALAPELQQYCQ